MSAELEEVSHELERDRKKRVHVLVFEDDWNELGLMYGDAVKRGNVIRMILRDYVKRIRAKAEQKL